MGRVLIVAIALVLTAAAPAQAGIRAGAAVVDATWHVGASAGQYASDPQIDPAERTVDPAGHATAKRPSYGVQSRLQARALVVEGADGTRVALVKNDLYIPQDLLWRRTALILEAKDIGIGRGNLTMTSTHDHSSPFYSSTSPGAWTFQDVYDVRFFDYYAKRMALAVERAARDLRPARVGASVSYFDKAHRHSFGPAIADDGSPAGYPNSDADHDLTVVRFDDISDPAHPKPLANLVNWSLHPEMLDGNDLISADYVAPLQRMADRATGAITIYTQNAVGTAEPERSTYHSIHERLEFTHREYAQSEYAARLIADAVIDTWRDVARGTPPKAYADRYVGFRESVPVEIVDRFYPGPFSHPYPSAQNCRADPALEGDPRLGGLPSCESPNSGIGELFGLAGIDAPPLPDSSALDPGANLSQLGPFLPDNVSAPSYSLLEEDVSVHLQAIRLGNILLTVCSCEQWADQARNIKSRTNVPQGDQYTGYDWSRPQPGINGDGRHDGCRRNGDGTYGDDGSGTGTWTCPNPEANRTNPDAPAELSAVTNAAYQRMRAQVAQPADGWNELEHVLSAENEPGDARAIRGNYSRDELPARLGYRLTVPIGMANDYNGYIASYREYQRGDHYRKALTGWGPHSSDYMASRLVTLAALLKDAGYVPPLDQRQEEVLQPKTDADLRNNDLRAAVLGQIGDTSIAAYEDAVLRDDAGEAEVVEQPKKRIRRFSSAFFTFNGGNNFVDNPRVRVQRRVGGRWVGYADQSGEVQTTLEFPQGEQIASYLSGSFRWEWTAHFEAFISPFDTGGRPRATPVGEYRFVADGRRQKGGDQVPYHLASRPFRVRRWDGITIPSLEPRGGRVHGAVGPRTAYELPRVREPGDEPPDCGTGDSGGCPEAGTRAAAPPATEGGPKLRECDDPEVAEGTVRSVIGPVDYPDSYASPARFITTDRTVCRDPAAPNDPRRFEWFCFECSFRPWVDAASVSCAETIVVRRDGAVERVGAAVHGARFSAAARLRRGEAALIARGGIRDENGERNGTASEIVSRGSPSAAVLARARRVGERGVACGRAARLPGTFRDRGRDRRHGKKDERRPGRDRDRPDLEGGTPPPRQPEPCLLACRR